MDDNKYPEVSQKEKVSLDKQLARLEPKIVDAKHKYEELVSKYAELYEMRHPEKREEHQEPGGGEAQGFRRVEVPPQELQREKGEVSEVHQEEPDHVVPDVEHRFSEQKAVHVVLPHPAQKRGSQHSIP